MIISERWVTHLYYQGIFRQGIQPKRYRNDPVGKKDLPKAKQKRTRSNHMRISCWVTPAGRPKTQQCTAFLDELESENIIQLPPKQRDTIRNTLPKLEAMNFDTTEIAGDIRSYEP
ncbi:MAG: hypothetical protein ACOX27_09235 [Caldicoprobacterales bacterium]